MHAGGWRKVHSTAVSENASDCLDRPAPKTGGIVRQEPIDPQSEHRKEPACSNSPSAKAPSFRISPSGSGSVKSRLPGFSVELWGWEDEALDAIAADPDIQIASMPGWGPGSMVHPDGVETFLEGARKNLVVARRIGCRNLAVASGELDRKGRVVHAIAEHPADRWITAYRCLCELAEIAEKEDVSYNFEVLNTKVDHAGYPFPHLEDGARLIRQVDSPRIRLLWSMSTTLRWRKATSSRRFETIGKSSGTCMWRTFPGATSPVRARSITPGWLPLCGRSPMTARWDWRPFRRATATWPWSAFARSFLSLPDSLRFQHDHGGTIGGIVGGRQRARCGVASGPRGLAGAFSERLPPASIAAPANGRR